MTDEATQEVDETAIEAKAAEEKRIEREHALAAHGSHPGVRLRGILKDMSAPGNLDINSRVGVLHQAVTRLIQVIAEHTPEPPPHPDEVAAKEEPTHAEG